ncbi:hypothetical protein A0H81_01697 [Grifola frondosa]|uniref:Asl1-like glycosyl hydrolase catalytic domain-containing protein n=1 Tax=Grifola frondosa TaxID=5627 RepID=A0A1C7MLF0_GRIFR|nr:hypothetical protein A0H81_01697 [Grifola frondosa]
MKFSASLVSLALLLAGVAEASHMQKRHVRRGPSATVVPTSNPTAPPQLRPAHPPLLPVPPAVPSEVCLSTMPRSRHSSTLNNLPNGVEYVPMLWGTDAVHTSSWNAHANAAIANGATALLGFNEPDLNTQSNLTPQAAAQAWMTYMQPFAGKAKLVSPAITNGGPPMGTAWLDSFMSECQTLGCTIDAIAAHIYDSATNTPYFQSYITDLGTRYNKPVWITEFSGSGTTDQQSTTRGS